MNEQGIDGTNVVLDITFLCQQLVFPRNLFGQPKVFISNHPYIYDSFLMTSRITFAIPFCIMQSKALKPYLTCVNTLR